MHDAATPPDAARPDAAVVATADASVTAVDAGGNDGTQDPQCACDSTSREAPGWLALGLMALTVLRRRR